MYQSQILKIDYQQRIQASEVKDLYEKGIRAILTKSRGTDNISEDAKKEAKRLGIHITGLNPYSTASVAEWSFFALHMAARRTKEMAGLYNLQIGLTSSNKEHWRQGTELCNKKTLIIGYGKIGKAIEEIAQGYKMETKIWDPYKNTKQRNEEIEDYLQEAEIIFLACPLTPETKGFMGRNSFEAMKKKPIIINCARAGLIENETIEWAIGAEQIEAYAVDEAIKHRIAHHSKCITTPHIAWYTKEAATRKKKALREKLRSLENLLARTETIKKEKSASNNILTRNNTRTQMEGSIHE